MKVTTLGIDLAKSTFSVHGIDGPGTVVPRPQLTRKQLLPVLENLPACLVGMEACAGAHYWAREIERLGHTVRLMSPHFVAPYRKSQKNDGNDVAAICEAVGRPSKRFVPVKSTAQQDVQAFIESASSSSSGARLWPMKSVAGEYGIVIAQGIGPLRRQLPLILEAAQQLANHESPRTTKLYDRRQDEISLDEVEKIGI
jgi:transposase